MLFYHLFFQDLLFLFTHISVFSSIFTLSEVFLSNRCLSLWKGSDFNHHLFLNLTKYFCFLNLIKHQQKKKSSQVSFGYIVPIQDKNNLVTLFRLSWSRLVISLLFILWIKVGVKTNNNFPNQIQTPVSWGKVQLTVSATTACSMSGLSLSHKWIWWSWSKINYDVLRTTPTWGYQIHHPWGAVGNHCSVPEDQLQV